MFIVAFTVNLLEDFSKISVGKETNRLVPLNIVPKNRPAHFGNETMETPPVITADNN